ncbi:hypothetical protein FGB62_185g02 [Gracilaria domingensis]|nr:hypothetical protein FGB62_185g02 [Gracilaria domingensis]
MTAKVKPFVTFLLLVCLSSEYASCTDTHSSTAWLKSGNLYPVHFGTSRFLLSRDPISDHLYGAPSLNAELPKRETLRYDHEVVPSRADIHDNHATRLLHDTSETLYPESIRPSLAASLKQKTRQAATGTGLNGDSCEASSDCKEPRRCLDNFALAKEVAVPCPETSLGCTCVRLQVCVSTNECPEGESCALLVPGIAFCVSNMLIDEAGVQPVPALAGDNEPSISGLNGDVCFSNSDCRGSRECLGLELTEFVPCSSRFLSCVCFDFTRIFCVTDDDCDDGEGCQQVGGRNGCLSKRIDFTQITQLLNGDRPVDLSSLASGATETEEGVCIALHSLQHLRQDELLYEKPRLAKVLCDSSNSCATPGHMVSYNEEVMMMKTYCERRGCTRKVMYVNSPRFRRALRIDSNTNSLSFTAVASRYELVAEERILSLGVRLGLL